MQGIRREDMVDMEMLILLIFLLLFEKHVYLYIVYEVFNVLPGSVQTKVAHCPDCL